MVNKVDIHNGNRYKYVQKLGAGTYGTTWMAIMNGTKKVAIKLFTRPGRLDQDDIEDIKEDWEIEINALMAVLPKCCPYAVCIKDFFFSGKSAKIIMDFVRGESLNKQIVGGKKGIPLKKRQKNHTLLKNLVKGIESIHSMGVVHQDIKGDNIMYDFDFADGLYRYIDFGLSCVKTGEKQKKDREHWPCGTIGTRYTAPEEIVNTHKKKAIFDWKILEAHDYWSIGVVLLRWYTYDGSREYYPSIVNNYAQTDKEADKLSNEVNAYSHFPYYFAFPEELLCLEIGKIKNLAVRAIIGLLLLKDPMKRWEGFQTVKYMLDPEATLAEMGAVKKAIEKLRL